MHKKRTENLQNDLLKLKDEELRYLRLWIAKLLESRLKDQEAKYFRRPAIGARHD